MLTLLLCLLEFTLEMESQYQFYILYKWYFCSSLSLQLYNFIQKHYDICGTLNSLSFQRFIG